MMQRVDSCDKEVHYIVVHEIDGNDGQVEYEVVHPGCEEHRVSDGAYTYTYYNCGVQYIIDNEGIKDALEDELKVGTIAVRCCSVYDEYTRESDAWLEVVND